MSAPPSTTSFPTGSIVANTNLTAVITTCTFSSPECAFFFCGTQHQNVTYDEQTQTATCGINQYVADVGRELHQAVLRQQHDDVPDTEPRVERGVGVGVEVATGEGDGDACGDGAGAGGVAVWFGLSVQVAT
jgi:hypothetical protein